MLTTEITPKNLTLQADFETQRAGGYQTPFAVRQASKFGVKKTLKKFLALPA
ncbi:MAG: hypothetical protein J5895_00885 [Alphaproteobacteria bacterium]|nr:hypothetical protein [Alphaproteobacteria bacterium]